MNSLPAIKSGLDNHRSGEPAEFLADFVSHYCNRDITVYELVDYLQLAHRIVEETGEIDIDALDEEMGKRDIADYMRVLAVALACQMNFLVLDAGVESAPWPDEEGRWPPPMRGRNCHLRLSESKCDNSG